MNSGLLTICLQATPRGGGENRLLNATFSGRRPSKRLKQGVKRTHKAAPPHHAVAPDCAEGRLQVNRVVRQEHSKRRKKI